MKHKQPQIIGKIFRYALVILILQLIQSANGFSDYTYERMADCKVDYSKEERNQKFKMHIIDQYIIIVLAPISIISTLVIIFIFLRFKQSRKQPSDIIFCISFSDLILSIHWFSQAMYALLYDSVPDDDSLFCQVNSFFSCSSGASQYLYNVLFCIYLITRIRNSIRGFRLKKKIIHFFTIIGSIIFYFYLYFSSKTELNLYGMCSYKVDNTSWIMGVSVFSIYLLLSWFTIFYFKTYVPNNSTFQKQRSEFLKFYYYYVLTVGTSWSVLAISNTLVGLNCTYGIEPALNVFITIGNLCKLVTPIILSVVRYTDPTLQECIQNHRNQNDPQNELSSFSLTTNMVGKSESNDLNITNISSKSKSSLEDVDYYYYFIYIIFIITSEVINMSNITITINQTRYGYKSMFLKNYQN